LDYEAAVIEQYGAQSRELLASAGAAGAAVQATWHDVAVACVLAAHGRINDEQASVEIADSENYFANKIRVIRKN
jgi:hypothetical protein